ncbi:hypothetical protein Pmani_016519 [Petrolisthes manimaculis]|uniref:Uncharacterized protein n=1 Tax=Petrolisthes manimaculis TaxID=1843537 RepID=A0AAE1PQ64_9EUCA|nr:hypothetical protein Pmani_016519 [Petrolisthes manimaculis]
MYMNRAYVSNIDPRNEREFLMVEQVYLGASVIKRLSENPNLERNKEELITFRVKCRAFLVTAADQIKRRFDFNDKVLSNLSVLEPASSLGIYGTCVESLIPFAMKLPRIIHQDDSTLQQLDDEWRKLEVEDLPENILNMAKHTGLTKEKRPDQFGSILKTLVDDEGIAKYKCLSDFALGWLFTTSCVCGL